MKILKAELSEKDLDIRQDAEVELTSPNRVNFLKPCGLGDRCTGFEFQKGCPGRESESEDGNNCLKQHLYGLF